MFDNTVEENVNIYDMHKRYKERMHHIKIDLKELNRVEEVKEPEHLNTQQIKLQLEDDYEKKKVNELKILCKEKGIVGYSKF